MPEDYDLLLRLIGSADRICLSPNIATEIDNFLNDYGRSTLKKRWWRQWSALLKTSIEVYKESVELLDHADADRMCLGLADWSVAEIAYQGIPVLTTDSKLHGYLSTLDGVVAHNFNHYRSHLDE